ncbi:1-deoxy-D-xylulose-5-phosphate reductoisomerase [Limnohabitans radicicola]|uniref:1-deoxy-D-xylulose 5-phosphate reductoisomerase n=1 Tax=Limnohabitans radicicola TaxID=2771427 RepID=A0A927FG61_9BURK|nr:1-deoxy-D-xylulose-5-phosphate reductoisomerase [Limnohabitans radicicola]MBD8050835.1 1-deoxy-D-xylulose-5-phosphate reductoisomerase [Limnohabitans radicicola]
MTDTQAKQRITVLGSTGSIGTNTLDVLGRHPDRFEVHALTASSQVEAMLAQCARFKPRVAVMAQEAAGRQLAERVRAEGLVTEVRWGAAALDEVSFAPEVDAVMAAIVGAAGLSPCLAAARAGKRLLLANKEALVVGGEVFLAAVRQGGATLLPIDSEHSAIFQSLPDDPSTWGQRIDKIILTASGGPFRAREPQSLRDVTPEQACAHPNWVMGRKISVDSATMMNKALEVIEARYLFGVTPDQLEVVIHPQSIIHSMVQYKDNSVVAQLGTPDMRVPIAYGLSWPERMASGASPLDFKSLSAMTFEAMDAHGHTERFPGLQLAWQTLRARSGSCAILNAANEIAVEAFLNRQIRFDQIHAVNQATLSALTLAEPGCLDDLMDIDRQGRETARGFVGRWAS